MTDIVDTIDATINLTKLIAYFGSVLTVIRTDLLPELIAFIIMFAVVDWIVTGGKAITKIFSIFSHKRVKSN